ncbi:MAG TPA: hypothetical protein VKZ81_02130 [Pseudonocardia sp.]|nr:hypothetical protein [Pseudonocardia sp.]HLU54232.1 hypothetical protein [Pseudonocardia sp.]
MRVAQRLVGLSDSIEDGRRSPVARGTLMVSPVLPALLRGAGADF